MYGPDHDGGPPDDRPYGQPSSGEMHFQIERERELANRTPTSLRQNGGYGTPTRAPGSPALSLADRNKEGDPRESGERNRSRNGRTASGRLRTCKKCGEPLTGQFVRALDGTFHLDCFRCRVSVEPSWSETVRRDERRRGSEELLGCVAWLLTSTFLCRTVTKSSPPSSSPPTTKMATASIPYARPTTSAGSVCYATNVAGPCEAHT